ncbi:MAG: hypothetical protein ACP5JG_09525 [Anaerolineae bacterium]
MRARPILAGFVVVFASMVSGIVGCGGLQLTPTPSPMPSLTPSPTATPPPTWTPTPIPTATPIPPAELTVRWPDTVSPLTPVPVEAMLVQPPGVEAHAEISATVMDPEAAVYATFDLTSVGGGRYRSSEFLQLPLEPLPGYWWLIVHVSSQLPVTGDPALFFSASPVAYRALSGLPADVQIQVPAAFKEVVAQGSMWAGGRVWTFGAGEVALWWAPGPTEELLLNNALVMLEATQAAGGGDGEELPSVSEAIVTTWQGRPAFEFPERWKGPGGGPGRAWVIQGSDFWLYTLRVRALAAASVPPLHREVAQTFAFVENE